MKINVIANNTNEELTSKEKQIIHVAILNILVLLNAIITKQGMVSNPIDDGRNNLGYEVHFEKDLTVEEKNEFTRRAQNQISTFLAMSDIAYVVEIEKR